ncbi:TIGR04066 family peptide maturation system protein [Ruminiclostridium cellobioparum]|jgi:peptide maturation system protein (TIGR04066 family)|uniref:TIGR04066 family peptide maturation system protein n=1 Tax=Ruminiclostridium cellobioparum TaxID=29355 RepID=UPI0028B1BA95|nr:TIGR04066 family peptide maturation system protein [Ruminiclostridium cellobioparum]
MCRAGLIYPYNGQFTPFLRYGCVNHDFNELILVSPEGWGMTNKDAGRADNGSFLGLTVTSDFKGELEHCDTVIFCDYSLPLEIKRHIYPKILEAIHKKKDIICLLPLDMDLEYELRAICRYEGVKFDYYKNGSAKTFIEDNKGKEDMTIKTLNVPVVFVLGIGERTNKFDIQLALRGYYTKNGYRVSQIGTRDYCEWAGFHSFPEFMFDKTLSEIQKIIFFNNYVKSIEITEKPDIFIIGVPGGIIPINDVLYQDFGILAYQISCAVKPDVCILSLYYEQYQQNLLDEINNSVRHRFGFEIDCLNLANVRLDITNSIEKRKAIYFNIDKELCEKVKAAINLPDKPVFNISNGQDAKEISEFTRCILEEYSEIVIVNES